VHDRGIIVINSHVDGAALLQIVDLTGRVVWSIDVSMTKGENAIELAAPLSSGAYTLRLNSAVASVSRSFIRE
jgi:hypothetical protein